jgi:cell division protease FtsH
MDDEALKMINEQYDRAKKILTEHKDGHNQLAQLLIEREVIFAEDVEKIFGKRPWISRSEEIMDEENKATIKALEEKKAKELENKNAEVSADSQDSKPEQQADESSDDSSQENQ